MRLRPSSRPSVAALAAAFAVAGAVACAQGTSGADDDVVQPVDARRATDARIVQRYSATFDAGVLEKVRALDGVSLAALATMHRVDRATISRWIAAARRCTSLRCSKLLGSACVAALSMVMALGSCAAWPALGVSCGAL